MDRAPTGVSGLHALARGLLHPSGTSSIPLKAPLSHDPVLAGRRYRGTPTLELPHTQRWRTRRRSITPSRDVSTSIQALSSASWLQDGLPYPCPSSSGIVQPVREANSLERAGFAGLTPGPPGEVYSIVIEAEPLLEADLRRVGAGLRVLLPGAGGEGTAASPTATFRDGELQTHPTPREARARRHRL